MKVIGTKILVKKVDENQPEERLGNLVIPGGDKDYDTCEVVCVGEEVKGVEPEMTVLTYKNSGHELKVDGVKYRVITPAEILIVK